MRDIHLANCDSWRWVTHSKKLLQSSGTLFDRKNLAFLRLLKYVRARNLWLGIVSEDPRRIRHGLLKLFRFDRKSRKHVRQNQRRKQSSPLLVGRSGDREMHNTRCPQPSTIQSQASNIYICIQISYETEYAVRLVDSLSWARPNLLFFQVIISYSEQSLILGLAISQSLQDYSTVLNWKSI